MLLGEVFVSVFPTQSTQLIPNCSIVSFPPLLQPSVSYFRLCPFMIFYLIYWAILTLLYSREGEFHPTKLNSDRGSTQLRQGRLNSDKGRFNSDKGRFNSDKTRFSPDNAIFPRQCRKMLNCYGLPRVSRYNSN